MKIFCTASDDAYITDKIIQERFRAIDANTGRAGTLDLFKLYDETRLLGSSSQPETTRILIKFDLTKARELMSKNLNISSQDFNAKIKLFDIRSGHSVPSNFTIIAHPLNQKFDEGIGRNLTSFSDLDATNYITASINKGSVSAWFVSGANHEGLLGSNDIDIIGSGTVANTHYYFYGTQHFENGTEDLSIDVTKTISGTLAGYIPDQGFRIAFSGSDDTDKKSRFIKRFGSRHSANPLIRPRLEISFDDSIQDNRGNFYFDSSGSIFIQNSLRSSLSNLKVSENEVLGKDCLKVKLVKGNYSKTILGSQHTGTLVTGQTGIYSASFYIDSEDSSEYSPGKSLSSLISQDKKVKFDEYWYSLDGTKGFYTGSLTINLEVPSNSFIESDVDLYSLNSKTQYNFDDEDRIILFGQDRSDKKEKSSRKRLKRKSEIFDNVHYRVLDADSLFVVFDFDETNNSTRVSTDSNGMYFDFHFNVLPRGRAYLFEFLLVSKNTKKIIRDKRSRFTVI